MQYASANSNLSGAYPLSETQAFYTGQVAFDHPFPITTIKQQMRPEPLALLVLFISPRARFEDVVHEASRCFPGIEIAACTTAGEIGEEGYGDGLILAIGLPESSYTTQAMLIQDLDKLDSQDILQKVALARMDLESRSADMTDGFAFVMVDGLSLREDTLTATLAPALRDVPLFGGSAGDGTDFAHTQLALNGTVASNAAVLTLIRTRHKTRVFSLDHLVPTERQMVVTEADPDRRIVKSINAEPAAAEYARIVGKEPGQLDRFTFAAHPVVVRIGGTHHVRAIQQVNAAGDLVFFSAIDEGMVLTVATAGPMAEHLDRRLTDLTERGTAPSNIIGCDCILRRIEAEQSQLTRDMSQVLVKHKVIGFSTYGEQIGTLHVNHTMSGVAIYPRASTDD